MTTTEFLNLLYAAADLQREEELEYNAIVPPALWIFMQLLAQRVPQETFELIEWALESGDDDTQTLCITGLFETLQNMNYRQGPPDLIETHLLPRSREAWQSLIASWAQDPNVRTLAQWRSQT